MTAAQTLVMSTAATPEVGTERERARSLAVLASEGDQNAFADLVHMYAERLARYLMLMGISGHDAEDLVQDTFIRAHAAIDRYKPRYAFTTWLYTIGRRLALNFLRDRKRHRALEDLAPTAAPEEEEPRLERGMLWIRAQEILNERQYEALWLFYGEDLPLDEVGRVLGIRTGTAKVTVHRARAKLAEHLDPHEWTV